MTTPQDPRRHPLQDDEVELARVLRALPAGEPSAKLDAAILAAASDAVAAAGSPASRRRVRPAWALPTWAIGTAAAAVLAVGVGVQLMPPPSSTKADRAQTPAAPAAAITESDDRLGVEFVERPREIPPTYPPPQPRREQPHVERESAPAPSPPPPPPPAVAAPEPQAFPAPTAPRDAGAFAPPPGSLGETDAAASAGGRADSSRLRQSTSELNRIDAERRARARQLAQHEAAREEQAEAGRAQAQLADAASDETSAFGATAARDAAAPTPPAANEQIAADADVAEAAPVVAAPAPSPAPAAAAPPAVADRASTAAPTAGVAAPATVAAAKAETFPPVAEDAKLLPAAWLERIRARWRAGDRDGARASLATLRERHPQLVIPDDLQPLLR